MERPKLRALEAMPREIDGRLTICLRDPQGLTEHQAALSPQLAQFLFTYLDGTRTLAEIEEEMERVTDDPVDLSDIVAQLDEALFLESERFEEHRERVLAEYRAGPTRPCVALTSFPDDLAGYLDGLYEGVDLPPADEPIAALAIPHLDLRSGGRAAARGLAGLAESFAGDTVVILGVGHQLGALPYALTKKSFETPLGTVPLAGDLYDRVVNATGSWVVEEELVHRTEHSVEYAAALLRHALGDRDFRILPVLCGSFHHHLVENTAPESDPFVEVFLETLREEAADALILASVDLAHMGPFYGDPAPLTPGHLARIREEDEEMLGLLAARDTVGFLAHHRRGGDRRRVCGLSALYTTLALLPEGPPGRLVTYEQPVFPEEGNTVTICSMAWSK